MDSRTDNFILRTICKRYLRDRKSMQKCPPIRGLQKAITQVLSPIYEKQFSENSYGFRPCRSAHDALKQCQTNVNDGYGYVVDMDLEKFFDTVCQSKLIEVLSRTIKDGRIISLIHKYTKCRSNQQRGI